jgi:hypothetical protein
VVWVDRQAYDRKAWAGVIRYEPGASRLTDEVKADTQKLWAKLLALYEGGAHIALGYSSWADYCQQEFRMSNGHSYRLLQAARVVNQLPIGSYPHLTSQVPESEGIARELAPLLNNPQDLGNSYVTYR